MSLETPNLRKALDTLRAVVFNLGDRLHKADWDESQHPRGPGGQFGEGSGGGASQDSTPTERFHNKIKTEKSADSSDLTKYIRHEGDQWTVYSEAGKPMGTYDSEAGAKKRLQQIEYFKHRKSIDDLRNVAASLTKTETQRVIDTAISSPPVKNPSGQRPPSPQEDSGLTDGVSPILIGVRPPKLQAQRFPGNTASEGTGSTGGGIGPNVGAYKT